MAGVGSDVLGAGEAVAGIAKGAGEAISGLFRGIGEGAKSPDGAIKIPTKRGNIEFNPANLSVAALGAISAYGLWCVVRHGPLAILTGCGCGSKTSTPTPTPSGGGPPTPTPSPNPYPQPSPSSTGAPRTAPGSTSPTGAPPPASTPDSVIVHGGSGDEIRDAKREQRRGWGAPVPTIYTPEIPPASSPGDERDANREIRDAKREQRGFRFPGLGDLADAGIALGAGSALGAFAAGWSAPEAAASSEFLGPIALAYDLSLNAPFPNTQTSELVVVDGKRGSTKLPPQPKRYVDYRTGVPVIRDTSPGLPVVIPHENFTAPAPPPVTDTVTGVAGGKYKYDQ